MMRWLTRASVLQFFDIVDRSLTDKDSKRMWAYRRAFWTSYLMGKDSSPKITEAWVAFGTDAARIAREVARQTGDRSFEAFGLHNEKSDQHSALIVRINGKTIVDWSHSGKCQFWPSYEDGAPQLYNQRYIGSLSKAPVREAHSAPQTYYWQKKFAEIIEGTRIYAAKPSWRP